MCVIDVAAEIMFIAAVVANGLGVLFVQDVIMAGSVEEEDAGIAIFRKDVVIDCPALASVHVLHQDGDV